jgi:RNA polymerase sigma factor (sigma-70 family)
MMTNSMTAAAASPDADLVVQSINGNREAFGQIVSRYQSLVCSLAYSATGSLGQSEDLAQETFITAWTHLRHLREHNKLRSWLCGIARNRINNALRREGRQPLTGSEPLEAARELPATEPQPHDQAMAREEEALLWSSLERIPQIYREPLILFYREHQSIEKVAAALDLNEDATKQRLSRGRKLLHREVLAFVEGALARTNPGKAFTVGVIMALPVFATSAKAATIGAAAAKGSAVAKASAVLGISGAILGPVMGVIGGWLGVKASLENARSDRERKFIHRTIRMALGMAAGFVLAQLVLAFIAARCGRAHVLAVTLGYVGITFSYAAVLVASIMGWNRILRRIREEEGTAAVSTQSCAPFEYRSRWTFLGLPLIHVKSGKQADGRAGHAVGWIAIGDTASGFFACGGASIGVISFGGCAVGLVSCGGVGLGLISIAGFAVGGWAMGGAAVGYLAGGGCALGWLAAKGGMAVAHTYAIGGSAHALNFNDDVARTFMAQSPFLSHDDWFLSNVALLAWLPMLLVFWQFLRIRKARRTQSQGIRLP